MISFNGFHGFWAIRYNFGRLPEFIDKTQLRPRRVDHRPFKDVFQLANIAGPVIAFQGVHYVFSYDFNGFAHALGNFFNIESDKQRYVIAAIAKWRYGYRKYVQAIPEILTKIAVTDLFFQIAIGGGNNPHIDFDGLRTAHPFELAILKNSQELCLKVYRQFTEFIKKKSGTIGDFKSTEVPCMGTGKGTLLMPNNSFSMRLAGSVAQLTFIKVRFFRRLE